jgi:dTDP-glucose 4,6-dehydratase
MSKTKLLVTGGCGFIGSSFVRKYSKTYDILVLDFLTYAADRKYIDGFANLAFGDITDYTYVKRVCTNFKPQGIINFAAESHVDRSISGDDIFLETNTQGVLNLLHIVKELGIERYFQVSTDEVQGSILEGEFKEEDGLNPRNAYSASKASAEHFCNAYVQTHGLDIVISRGSNSYGPRQYPEKLIPVAIKKLKANKSIPIYGTGNQIRDWLYVDDHASGIQVAFEKGLKGEVYNVAGQNELANKTLISLLLDKYIEITGRNRSTEDAPYTVEVEDRLGHDFRYAMNADKLKALGWRREMPFDKGLEETIRYYTE